jgi:NB-ARC domain
LLIFDNADDIEILRVAWPGNSQGSVLVTTRDFNAVHNLTLAGHHVQPLDDTAGSDMLLKLTGLNTQLPSNKENAQAISHALGGLPLALAQIGGFISKRKIPLHEFLPLYERHSAAIDSKKVGVGDYEHTLSTVWEMSLSKLSGSASRLLNLLIFFEPDAIHELVLIEGSKLLGNKELEFLQDEIEYINNPGM